MIEGFSGSSDSKERRNAYVDFVSYLLAFIISLLVLGFIGQYLWNEVVVDLVSVAKPSKSVWNIIGLMVFSSLIVPL
jgi:hypothetical protein